MNSGEVDRFNFEKWVLGMMALLIVASISWMAQTVNQNQLQYTRIQEQLRNQGVLLENLQRTVVDSAKWRSRVDSKLAVFEQRLDAVEKRQK
ncbi:hypothetical protein [Pseudoalteromonas sp.]|uniref:hypothetical protein n=1 Tax=Pseudoalteromonas sp. TaxID=53249 RepID=UPI0023563BE6|nr:hypothetical protein [Pseudoalteromonas sp.]